MLHAAAVVERITYLLFCPQCPYKAGSEQTLAVHLHDEHDVEMPEAVERARQVDKEAAKQNRRVMKRLHTEPAEPEEEQPMAKKNCGYCKHPKTAHRETCPYRYGGPGLGKGKRQKRVRGITKNTDTDAVQREISALTEIIGALAPLDSDARSRVMQYVSGRFDL